jgi:lantibiotic biosynthesis protein
MSNTYLEGAARIANRLAAQAIWDGDRCTWMVADADPTQPTAAGVKRTIAGSSIYKGTAGIGLFLTEFGAVSGDAAAIRHARGAFRHAIANPDVASASFSVHSGPLGVAYALARHAMMTGDDECRDAGVSLIRAILGTEERDRGLDVIGGAAGAIPMLLLLAKWGFPDARESAIALGEHLIRSARRRPVGWSWGGASQGLANDLAGLAHGASGFGTALLELYVETGDPAYRYAGEQAFLYESRWFDKASQNWYDLRNSELQKLAAGSIPLSEAIRNSPTPPYWTPRVMSAWCHGAPGIGLSRLRAYAITGDERWKREAVVAVNTTRHGLESHNDLSTYCLCHGALGNCETLLAAGEVLADDSLRSFVEALAERGVHTQGGAAPWRSGIYGVPDPSLLLGEAGIGHALLRLVNPAIPSVLFPSGSLPIVQAIAEPDTSRATQLRADHVTKYFGSTIRACRRLGIELPRPGTGPSSDVIAMDEWLERAACDPSDPQRSALIADIAAVDRAALAVTLGISDASRATVDDALRASADSVDWECATLQLAPDVRLVECERDWGAWSHDQESMPDEELATYLVRPQAFAAHVQRLAPAAYLVLAALRTSATVGEAALRVARTQHDVGEPEPILQRYRDLVLKQAVAAYRVGVIQVGAPALALAIAER